MQFAPVCSIFRLVISSNIRSNQFDERTCDGWAGGHQNYVFEKHRKILPAIAEYFLSEEAANETRAASTLEDRNRILTTILVPRWGSRLRLVSLSRKSKNGSAITRKRKGFGMRR